MHRRLAKTIAPARPRLIILLRPDIEILPLFADRRIDLLAKAMRQNAVSMVLRYLSTMPVIRGLLALVRAKPAKGSAKRSLLEWLAAGGSTFLYSERECAFVAVVGAALFGAAIGENTPRYGAVVRVEGQDPAVSEIGGRDQRLAIMELGKAGLGIGGDEG